MQDNWEWNVGEGLHPWVSINNKKNQHITKYGSKVNQNYIYNDIFIPLRRKIVQGPAKQFKVSVRGLTMFVFYFGVESLEQCANLGRLVIFDFLGNSHYIF